MQSFLDFVAERFRQSVDPTVAKHRKMVKLERDIQKADTPVEQEHARREKQMHLKDLQDKQRSAIQNKLHHFDRYR